jgi:hypothetical protein
MGPGYSLAQPPVDGGQFRFVNQLGPRSPLALPPNKVGPFRPLQPGPRDGGQFRFINQPPAVRPPIQIPPVHPAVAAALASLGAQRSLLSQLGLQSPVNPGGAYVGG